MAMTEEQLRALSLAVAEAVGTDEAYLPAETCPQGHENWDPDSADGFRDGVGELCVPCMMPVDPRDAEWNANAENRSWHPEWRIPRGEPKPFAEDPGLMIAAADEWCGRHTPAAPGEWTVGRASGYWATVFERGPRWASLPMPDGPTATVALARAYLAAVERWGR